MDAIFENIQIKGLLNILPETKKIDNCGINRYCAKKNTYTTDLFIYGMKYLLKEQKLSTQDIGAIVTVSFTPDYIIPQLSFLVHAALDLSEDVLCSDILEENSGYIKGLMDTMLLAEHMPDKKVVLLCGNISDKRKNDTVPFYGNDGANITVIQYSKKKSHASFTYSIDSSHIADIKKHSGGFYDLFHERGNQYTNNQVAVSVILQEKIPQVIRHLENISGISVKDIKYFFIPQSLELSIETIAEELDINVDCIIHNTNGVNDSITNTIHIVEKYSTSNGTGPMKCCLVGFGSGINYGGAILEISELEFCGTIHSDL